MKCFAKKNCQKIFETALTKKTLTVFQNLTSKSDSFFIETKIKSLMLQKDFF